MLLSVFFCRIQIIIILMNGKRREREKKNMKIREKMILMFALDLSFIPDDWTWKRQRHTNKPATGAKKKNTLIHIYGMSFFCPSVINIFFHQYDYIYSSSIKLIIIIDYYTWRYADDDDNNNNNEINISYIELAVKW